MAEKNDDKASPVVKKQKRHRSPNYPSVGLRDAVVRAGKLYKEDGKPGSSPEAAFVHIGFSSSHGQAQSVMSALKKFGLLDDKEGRIVPTKLAIDVFEFPPEHERHRSALKEMALKPDIYAELVNTYREHSRLPSDASLKPELVTDRGFNPAAVDGFLKDFRDSLTYAGLLDGYTLKLSDSSPDVDDPENDKEPAVGDYVQWTSAGMEQFDTSKQVVGISPDGEFAFVQESSSGLPMSELTLVAPPPLAELPTSRAPSPSPKGQPPMNPFYKSPRDDDDEPKPGIAKERCTLDEGPVMLTWPGDLSPESVEELEYWVRGIIRRARRKAGLEPSKD